MTDLQDVFMMIELGVRIEPMVNTSRRHVMWGLLNSPSISGLYLSLIANVRSRLGGVVT